jgi:hypothetical protein
MIIGDGLRMAEVKKRYVIQKADVDMSLRRESLEVCTVQGGERRLQCQTRPDEPK